MMCVLNAQAVTITGTVHDKIGNPVEEVMVSYLCDGTDIITPVQTDSMGYFEFTFEQLGIGDNALPNSISLGANYPNPFNPGTVIPLSTNKPGQFLIHDLLGRQVQSIAINGTGHFTITWGGKLNSGLLAPAGIYFYSFQTDENRFTGKMILMDGGGNSGLILSGSNSVIHQRQSRRRSTECDNHSITFSGEHITDLEIDFGENGYTEDTNIEQEVNRGPKWVCETDYSVEVDSVLMLDLGECLYNDDETFYSVVETEDIYLINDSLFIEVDDTIGFIVNVEGTDSDDIVLIENAPIDINGGAAPEWYSFGLDGLIISHIKISQNYLYASTRNDGIWKRDLNESDNEWEYWGLSAEDVGYDEYLITDFIQNEENQDEWVVTGTNYIGELPDVFKSQDNGENWYVASIGLDFYIPQYDYTGYTTIDKLEYSGGILLGWGGTFATSDDFGESWVKDTTIIVLVGPPQRINDLEKSIINNSHLWVGGESVYSAPVLYRTTDAGLNWEPAPLNIPHDNSITSIALHPTSTDIIYVAVAGLGTIYAPGAIYKATDGGDEWVNSWPNDPDSTLNPLFVHPDAFAILSIVIDENNPDHLFCSGGPFVYETFDDWNTWEEMHPSVLNNTTAYEMLYDSENQVLFIGTISGIFIYK